MDKTVVKPGEEIEILCQATENSFVSLLAVDQSVTLHGTQNDIDKSRIDADLSFYNVQDKIPELNVRGSVDQRYKDFEESNAFMITNAFDGMKTCTIKERFDNEINLDDADDSGLANTDLEDAAKEPPVRKNFPETWIFEDFEVDDNGKYKYEAKVPDTITSFILTGFAVHPQNGLGVAEQMKVTVFQDFFLNMYLPYSVRLGEILKVDISVFNFIEKPPRAVTVTVEIFNEGEFDFVNTKMQGSECVKTFSQEAKRSNTITVPNKSGSSTYFLVKPLVTGKINLKVKATTLGRKDIVEKEFLVEHEGITYEGNIQRHYILDNKDATVFDLPINNEKILPNSIYIEASVIGDLLGPALKNIQNLM
jgi:CD109 antigen